MKILVIGLDSAVPDLMFRQWWDDLPNLRALVKGGMWGEMRSTHPPITVPAWSSMMTGLDPGELGFYGFRNRKDFSYDRYAVANGTAIQGERVWDALSREGKNVILLGVPQTYPVRPVNGCIVADFLTPSTKHDYTYPKELKSEIERVSDGYVLDVANFRTTDKEDLLRRIYLKTEKHFRVAKHLMMTKPWDFFMMVEMGVDRIQHGFWSYCDPSHRKYQRGNTFENTLKDYYRYIDKEIGDLLSVAPRDTAVLLVSDHGAKKMDGGICLNEWLIREGYLKLHRYPSEPRRLEELEIDWHQTKAWGEGGYHGRIFLNVRGREPNGIIDPDDYHKVQQELIDKITALEDPDGNNIRSSAYRPEEIYKNEIRGFPPDLTVYFGNLSWRSVGSVGLNEVYTFDNDTGPDEANHDWNAVFMANRFATSLLEAAPGLQEQFHISQIASKIRKMSVSSRKFG
jgi:predicted AlkP superfamily phosphohydrolase/phosphomutase